MVTVHTNTKVTVVPCSKMGVRYSSNLLVTNRNVINTDAVCIDIVSNEFISIKLKTQLKTA